MDAEAQRIERLSQIIVTSHLTGDFPDDITQREFADVVIMDAVGRRVAALMQEAREKAGVTTLINLKDLEK